MHSNFLGNENHIRVAVFLQHRHQRGGDRIVTSEDHMIPGVLRQLPRSAGPGLRPPLGQGVEGADVYGGGDGPAGEDLVADSVEKAWSRFDDLRDRDAFDGWLLRIVANTYVSNWRSQRRELDWSA